MSWHIEDIKGQKREIAIAEDNKETSREQTETRMFGELVEEMRKNGSDLVAEVIEEKAEGLEDGRMWFMECTTGPLIEPGRGDTWTRTARRMGLSFNPDEHDTTRYKNRSNLTTETLISGLTLRSALLFCPLEGIEMYQFFRKISTKESAADIFHAVLNTLSGEIKSSLNMKSLNRLFRYLETKFNLQLGKIIVGLSSLEELELLLERRVPYLENFKVDIAKCRRDKSSCVELETVARTLPGEFCMLPLFCLNVNQIYL